MPIYKLREFQNGSQLGETVNVDAENLQVAKKQTLLRASIFADEQHIENELGVVLLKRIKGGVESHPHNLAFLHYLSCA